MKTGLSQWLACILLTCALNVAQPLWDSRDNFGMLWKKIWSRPNHCCPVWIAIHVVSSNNFFLNRLFMAANTGLLSRIWSFQIKLLSCLKGNFPWSPLLQTETINKNSIESLETYGSKWNPNLYFIVSMNCSIRPNKKSVLFLISTRAVLKLQYWKKCFCQKSIKTILKMRSKAIVLLRFKNNFDIIFRHAIWDWFWFNL